MYKGQQDDRIVKFHCPRYVELPSLPLYKDQVIEYIDKTLKTLFINSEDKVLTPTMLNNYVKQKVIPAPIHKKYNTEHKNIAILSVRCYSDVVCIYSDVESAYIIHS